MENLSTHHLPKIFFRFFQVLIFCIDKSHVPEHSDMLQVTKLTAQIDIFGGLGDSLDQKHSIYLVANSINWTFFDDSLNYYSSSDDGFS